MRQIFSGALFLFLFAFSFVNGQDSTAVKKKPRRAIAAIPMINYNRTQGIVLGALVSGYYKINKKDTISPSSSTGVAGMYTAQKSYALITFSQLFFAEDRWRVTAALGTA